MIIELERYGFSLRGWLKLKIAKFKEKHGWIVIYEYIALSKQDKHSEEE